MISVRKNEEANAFDFLKSDKNVCDESLHKNNSKHEKTFSAKTILTKSTTNFSEFKFDLQKSIDSEKGNKHILNAEETCLTPEEDSLIFSLGVPQFLSRPLAVGKLWEKKTFNGRMEETQLFTSIENTSHEINRLFIGTFNSKVQSARDTSVKPLEPVEVPPPILNDDFEIHTQICCDCDTSGVRRILLVLGYSVSNTLVSNTPKGSFIIMNIDYKEAKSSSDEKSDSDVKERDFEGTARLLLYTTPCNPTNCIPKNCWSIIYTTKLSQSCFDVATDHLHDIYVQIRHSTDKVDVNLNGFDIMKNINVSTNKLHGEVGIAAAAQSRINFTKFEVNRTKTSSVLKLSKLPIIPDTKIISQETKYKNSSIENKYNRSYSIPLSHVGNHINRKLWDIACGIPSTKISKMKCKEIIMNSNIMIEQNQTNKTNISSIKNSENVISKQVKMNQIPDNPQRKNILGEWPFLKKCIFQGEKKQIPPTLATKCTTFKKASTVHSTSTVSKSLIERLVDVYIDKKENQKSKSKTKSIVSNVGVMSLKGKQRINSKTNRRNECANSKTNRRNECASSERKITRRRMITSTTMTPCVPQQLSNNVSNISKVRKIKNPHKITKLARNKQNQHKYNIQNGRNTRRTTQRKTRNRTKRNITSQERIIEQDIIVHNVGVTYDNIAGLSRAKELLSEAVVLPLLMPDLFTGLRQPWKGVLLFGPPGTGKTMLAKATAGVSGTTFFNMSASTLVTKWRGESESLVRTLFEMARERSPSIIFIDEIDALVSKRGKEAEHEASRRLKSEIFTQMDGLVSESESNHVMVLATTNTPWDLDGALLRRLEKRIYIPLPDVKTRKEMIELNLSDISVSADLSVAKLANQTEGLSGSDIRVVCREASMMPMRRLISKCSPQDFARLRQENMDHQCNNKNKIGCVRVSDFSDAISKTRYSVSPELCTRFKEWEKTFGSS